MRKTACFITVTLTTLAVLVAAVSGCDTSIPSSQKISVAVSIMPQAGFVENIGGDKVAITVMVTQKADPHTYEPTPKQMKALSQAKLYAKVGSGIEFELVWMDKMVAANQKMLVVDCSQNIPLIPMAAAHDHDDKTHGGLDPHIWMSPPNAKIMVQNIANGLIQVDPANRSYYENNRNLYLQQLTQLDKDIRDGLSSVKNRKFLVYHPSFGYFAKEYNLTMLAIEEQGKEPTAAGIARVIQQAKDNNIRVVFASPQFNPQSARVIASAIGGTVVMVDDLAKYYVNNMRSILSELVKVMQ